MKNLINYIFRTKPTDEFAEATSWEALGTVIWEALKRTEPTITNMDVEQQKNYLTNEWIQEKSKELFEGREDELIKIQSNIAKLLNKIL